MADEFLEYCGSCNRSQKGGETCVSCGKRTVTWNERTETLASVKERWKKIYGGSK